MNLAVLIVEGDEPITGALVRALERRGHRVLTAASAERALALPSPDVFVCESRLSGADGIDLLSAVQARGDGTRVVLLLSDPTVEQCLSALELGASDLLRKPFRLTDLVRAVEGRRNPRSARTGDVHASDPDAEPEGELVLEYPGVPASVERCCRDLAAFALRRGVPPSTRARIAGCAGEIVDNAVRHGRIPPGGSIRVRAGIDPERPNWLRLEIRDEGVGFDATRTRTAATPGPARSGLSRAISLCESFGIRSAPAAGTAVELRFSLSGASLSDRSSDLSEADFLTPDEARELLGTLLEGGEPEVEGIPPAVAVVLGRLLCGPDLQSMPRDRSRRGRRSP
jgi:ActR/RegA family two-component response regulator/anti-sigma regulatory factor (Ser/Thr protein kinase)